MYLSRVKDIVPLKRFCEGKFAQNLCIAFAKNCKIRLFVYQVWPILEKYIFLTAFTRINVLEIFAKNVMNNEKYMKKFLYCVLTKNILQVIYYCRRPEF